VFVKQKIPHDKQAIILLSGKHGAATLLKIAA
jgi:hypothetical protein